MTSFIVHHLSHYNAEDGTEYTQVNLTRNKRQEADINETFPRQVSLETMVDEKEFDIATPFPSQNSIPFTIGSPTASIEPYASLISIHNDVTAVETLLPLIRERRATVSGPIGNNHTHKTSVHTRGRISSFPIIELDTVNEAGAGGGGGRQEALPYMEEIENVPPPLPSRYDQSHDHMSHDFRQV